VVLASGHLVSAVGRGKIRQYDNKKDNNYNYRKLRDLTLESELNYINSNKLRRDRLKERDSRRCGRRRKLPRLLQRRPNKQPATLKKLYNCPKRASGKLHNLVVHLESVKNVLLLSHLMYKLRWLHRPSQLGPPAAAAPLSY
jgi:hypothetical protein